MIPENLNLQEKNRIFADNGTKGNCQSKQNVNFTKSRSILVLFYLNRVSCLRRQDLDLWLISNIDFAPSKMLVIFFYEHLSDNMIHG